MPKNIVAKNEFNIDDDIYETLMSYHEGSMHPERYVLGKPHPDRARQFKPFAALRGYEELISEVMDNASKISDFADIEEPC